MAPELQHRRGIRLHDWRAEFALVLVAFVWGSTFVLVKNALAEVSTLLFLAIRFSLAGLVLGLAYRRSLAGLFERERTGWLGGLLAGICLSGGYLFQTFGLRLTTPSKSAFLTGLAIVLVPVLGAFLYRKLPRPAEAAGVAAATVGVALLTLHGPLLDYNPGDLLTLAGAVFFAGHVLVLGHFSPREGFERLSVLQVAVAALLGLSTFWWAEPVFVRWSPTVLIALGVTGLLATAAAFTVQAWAQQHTTPTRTALIFALEPVFAALTSYVWLGESLSGRALGGAALILAGILLVELKPRRRRTAP